jgi:hypothetical protein
MTVASPEAGRGADADMLRQMGQMVQSMAQP